MTLFKHKTTVMVRFSDTDAMGHCNNANYFKFMEEARIGYFRALYPEWSGRHIRDSLPFILGEIRGRFLVPAECGDTIDVWTGIGRMGTKSFTLIYKLVRTTDNVTVCEGDSTLVSFDYATGKSIPIPDDLRKRFESSATEQS